MASSWSRNNQASAGKIAYATDSQQERITKGSTSYGRDLLGVSREKPGTATTSYVRDPNGTLVSQNGALGQAPLHLHRLGSVVTFTDSSGQVAKVYTYGPHGEGVYESPETLENPYRVASGYLDSSSGLYKFGVRYYDFGFTALGAVVSAFRLRERKRELGFPERACPSYSPLDDLPGEVGSGPSPV